MKSENATIITQSTKTSTIQHPEKIISSDNNESFKVYIRIRPYIQKIIPVLKNSFIKSITSPKNATYKNNVQEKNMIKVEKNILYLEDVKSTKNKNNKTYIFDNIFNETTNNDTIFNCTIKSMINKILLGYNSTVLAYGVTGTGKTYTIFGDLSNNFKDEGIIFKACDYLFEKIESNKNSDPNNINTKYEIKISYIEIYNEIVKDLINENSPSLMIMEDPLKGVICSNVKEVIINDSIQLKKIINENNKRRTMASTDQNQFSSRSHAILQMSLEKKIKKNENNYDIIYSKFLFVDLAGSEKSLERGKRREEGFNINKSLFTLGNCLNILSEKSNTGKFVPYRDSKLTRILKDSLGGNILTVMLACISPCPNNYDETMNTLNYAFKAKKITKKVMKNIQEININNLQYKEMIDELKNEIFQLKQIIKNQEIKLKEKVDINNNKENLEVNIDNNINITQNESYKNEKDINNNITIDNDKYIENGQKTIAITERGKNKINKYLNNDTIDDINIDLHNKYIENLINNDLNIDTLKYQIELIKRDKNLLESYLFQENNEDINTLNKYNSIKTIYDKYIEVVNEKLVENIEQNMIYNYNIKEITELNISNTNKIKELEAQIETGEKNTKINEEINYTKKNIIDNNNQKEQILQTIQKNLEQKNELKKILLNLLENKSNTSDKFIHIIHEKDKLSKITKQYKEEIDNYVKIQKQKEEDMLKITRKIEILRAKLKEKDKKICELEKKEGKHKNENLNIKIFKNKILNQDKKREYSNFKNKRRTIISPVVFYNKNISINNKINSNKTSKDKNKSFKNKKSLSIFLSNGNNKIEKKINKNINRFQTDCNNKEIMKDKTKTNNNEISKYNELIIPKTTITLTDINPNGKEDINPLYIKIPKNNNLKKTPNNNLKKVKKIGNINNESNKRNSSLNNNIQIYSKKSKKVSVKSFKIDLIHSNNKSDLNIITIKDSSEKSKNINLNIDNNLNNIKEFQAEKINIDLTDLDKINSEQNLNDKINNIKYLTLKEDVTKEKQSENNNNIKSINKIIKNISRSNPKVIKENRLNNYNKKLSLKEARLEKKKKSEKLSQPKNELIYVESFINEYKKNKTKNILNNDKENMDDKKSINTEPNIDLLTEKESKCSFISYPKKEKYKTYTETIDLTLDYNSKDINLNI